MADESPTPEEQAKEVIYAEVVSEKALRAYESKLEGKSLSEIADELGYASPAHVQQAINDNLHNAAQYLSNDERTLLLRMELDRLDRLQAKLWPSAMAGDRMDVETILRIMDRRIKILGLDAVDTATQQQTVLVIGGTEASYIERLKELAE